MLFFSSRIQDKFEDNDKYINIKRIIVIIDPSLSRLYIDYIRLVSFHRSPNLLPCFSFLLEEEDGQLVFFQVLFIRFKVH